MDNQSQEPRRDGEERDIPVWDLGVRFFHWALLVLVVTSFVTIKVGGAAFKYHMWSGYAILALLTFRIVWGFVGGTHARFASFVRGPAAVLAAFKAMFDRAGHKPSVGHNPLGALSVLALLAALLFQAVSGLFVNDDSFYEAPLVPWITKAISDRITSLHHLNEKIIIALVVLHILAIAFYYFYHRENLVRPMLTGFKRVAGQVAESRFGSPLVAVILLALSAAGVYWLVNAASP
ncbi:MAG: cytochrome b/b6 domain-containing protein [Burkholderiales bacterium]